MLDVITARLERVRRVAARATLVPLLIRFGVGVSFLFAILIAWPPAIVLSQFVLLPSLAALWPAVAPRGRGPTWTVLVAVGGWVAGTSYYDGDVELWRVIALGTLLYLGHTLAALAAALPYDSLVGIDVVYRWLLRAATVVLISAVLTVIALGAAEALDGSAFVLATVFGLAAAIAAVLLLARLLKQADN